MPSPLGLGWGRITSKLCDVGSIQFLVGCWMESLSESLAPGRPPLPRSVPSLVAFSESQRERERGCPSQLGLQPYLMQSHTCSPYLPVTYRLDPSHRSCPTQEEGNHTGLDTRWGLWGSLSVCLTPSLCLLPPSHFLIQKDSRQHLLIILPS